MTLKPLFFRSALALTLTFQAAALMAQTAPVPHSKAPSKAAMKKAPPAATPAAASTEQVEAAKSVYYGVYECDSKQSIDISANAKYPAYVDLKHGATTFLMKPVVSSTGAVRLEDVKGKALLVQVANKSMLLNVSTGQRIADDCVHSKQRELMDAARSGKAAP